MFDNRFIRHAIDRSAENALDRRRFFAAAGVAGASAGIAALGSSVLTAAPASATPEEDAAVSDAAILNFALNLEYLEAEFYLRAVFGTGLTDSMITGIDPQGPVIGGKKVPFKTAAIRGIATEIANDERAHVAFLRSALGDAKVSRPKIDLVSSFTAAARAAGVVGPTGTFDPFASEENFLLGAYVFEDVGVTAYKGAAPLISSKTYLSAAAGILAVEAYHAGTIRSKLYDKGLQVPANKISDARDSLDGPTDDDQGITTSSGAVNLVPTDANSLAYGRTAERVLNVVFLTPNQIDRGGFFPEGVNGAIVASGNPGSATGPA
ncbi:Ferritin-like domain-containing protein [Curtobacterium sp. 9128]|uniref:ferritin-like domain-containing protein n=1 Tax=Curtobacterium sp. 9128 TaxID=1793722 RepID=UPI0007D7169F|nr:ferritin-like domain-containing protein [Curtobacterium sp. 9128]SBN62859.1 Ferritin-like domain-containing protein [Curtobacterium sp. 9128]